MINVGGYHENRGSVQYRGDTILCNLSTVGVCHDTCGGDYHEYRGGGCSVPWGYSNNKRFSPTVLNTPHGTHDILLPRAS